MNPNGVRALDTNVVLRYLLDDLPNQAERARRLIESEQVIGVTVVTQRKLGRDLVGLGAVACSLSSFLSPAGSDHPSGTLLNSDLVDLT